MNHFGDLFRQIHGLSKAEFRSTIRGETSTVITVHHSYLTVPYPVVPANTVTRVTHSNWKFKYGVLLSTKYGVHLPRDINCEPAITD